MGAKRPATAPPLPWFLVGQSMAGGVAVLASHRAWLRKGKAAQARPQPRTSGGGSGGGGGGGGGSPWWHATFAGCVAVAPLVTASKPPAPALALLAAVAKLAPHAGEAHSEKSGPIGGGGG